MYRGNTPYRVGAKIIRCFKSTSHAEAKVVLDRLRSRRMKTGYQKT